MTQKVVLLKIAESNGDILPRFIGIGQHKEERLSDGRILQTMTEEIPGSDTQMWDEWITEFEYDPKQRNQDGCVGILRTFQSKHPHETFREARVRSLSCGMYTQ